MTRWHLGLTEGAAEETKARYGFVLGDFWPGVARSGTSLRRERQHTVPWEVAAMTSSVLACAQCGQRNRVPAAASGTPRCGQCRSPLPWMSDAGDDDFREVAEQAPVPVLLDLWATWCGPCRMVSPALERLAEAYAGRIKLVKVDVDRAPGLSRRFEVRAVPTLMLLDHGRVIARQAGAAPEPELRRWLEDALPTTTGGAR